MRKTLWSALALVMVLTLAGCGEQSHTDNGGTDSATYTPDAGYTLGNTDVVQLNGFRAIDIEWVSGQVNVELYDGEGIQLSETLADGSDVTLQMEWRVDEDDSELDIRSQPQLMSSTEEKILTVKLPRSMVLYGLDIDAVSAGVSVDLTDEDTLSLSELDVTSVSGAISVYAANAGEISLSTTSGSISGSVRTQKLEADSVSGSIDLALDIMPTELEAETSSGSIVMQLCDLSTLPSPLPVEFKTTSGKLSSDVTFTTVEDAGWGRKELRDAALIVGSSRGNASGWLSPWPGRRPMKILAVPNSLHSELASCVSIELGICGPYHVLASGCAAGLDAVGMAAMLMRQGVVKRALAIGLDLPLCRELLGTYWASGMLSRNGLNDPYGPLADGMCISEGGAAIALELSSAPGIYVKDYLVNSDAYSPLGMPEDGKSIAALLEAALKSRDGAVPLTVCPHASGTAGNSVSERAALKRVFKDGLPDLRMMKPWTGHAIGGSGILELALMLVFAREGVLPPNPPWATFPEGGACSAEEQPLAGGRMLVKSAASMGGHNVVLSLAVDG